MPRPGPRMTSISLRLPLADAAALARRAETAGLTPSQQARADVQEANRRAGMGGSVPADPRA